MCGIAGGWWVKPPKEIDKNISDSLEKIAHRGPNDRGAESFRYKDGVVVLAHTRLSIIDLSSGGHQPMYSPSGDYGIIFNGEIYNYKELKAELISHGVSFRSDSDTEVLLAAWEKWGLSTLPKLDGMFAFVVFDKTSNKLTCVRDAFGIKPFFYSRSSAYFVFASEQGAVLKLRDEKAKINWQRSYDYLVHGDYDSTEETFVAGIKHLMPGYFVEISLDDHLQNEPQEWWKPDLSQSSRLSFSSAAEAVREKFLQNTRLHLRSDVPLGAALSGGIDSSAVVCAIKHVEPSINLNTFSYIANNSRLSEEKWVDVINGYTSSKAHKTFASGEDLRRDLDKMIEVQGEPFGSTSIYAQYRVFQLAKENGITVTLDGQGADELMAGYHGYPGHRLLSLIEERRFIEAHRFARRWGRWPGRSYKMALMYLGRLTLPDSVYEFTRGYLGRSFKPSWLKTELLIENGVRLSEGRVHLSHDGHGRRVVEGMARAIKGRGLPGLLRHGDRNSMAFSIESRVPFLTVSLANLLYSLPEEYLISANGETKSVFREAMRGIVPDEILNRKDKVGFATPEEDWLLGMADLVRDWLQNADNIEFLDREELLKAFDAVASGKTRFSWQVWRWVNFVRWFHKAGVIS